MKPDLILAHTSFLGHTGYANHSREFFTALNNNIPVRVRNFTHVDKLDYLTEEQKRMIIHQTWSHEPFEVGEPFDESKYKSILNIVLNETHHYYFYDKYNGPKVAYNVWESTRQPEQYFQKILEYDQFWCPTEWQKMVTIEQGYPSDKIFVVPEGIDPNIFKPIPLSERSRRDKIFGDSRFKFVLMGRWDYRKSIEEIIRAFTLEFKPDERVDLIINVDNPYSVDDMHSTEERLEYHELIHPNILVEHFMSFEKYVSYLQHAHCLVSCSRAEGWNLPLIEAIACGIPTICSDYGAQLEFAQGISHTVNIEDHLTPKYVFNNPDGIPGTWAEPDFDHLRKVMRHVYENHSEFELYASIASKRIKEKFNWNEAVKKALYAIDKIESDPLIDVPVDVESERELVRLNLGCGADIKSGYINIDTFNNFDGLNVEADILKLPFKNGCADEIYISHVMEHLGLYGVPKALIEFNRVLKLGAKLIIRVPNLDSCIEEWKKLDTEAQISKLDYIFGGQSHEGDFHKNGYTQDILNLYLKKYGFKEIKSIIRASYLSNATEIYSVSVKEREPDNSDLKINFHFVDGPFLEVLSNKDTRYYEYKFVNNKDGAIVHRVLHPPNHWTKPHRRWFTDWHVEVKNGDDLVFSHDYDAKGKRVLISFESKSLGDTIAWIQYCEEFRIKHKCSVIVSTFWNHLFQKVYPQLIFIQPGEVAQNIYAQYKIGCWDGDFNRNRYDWRETPLQKIACDILGLEYKEEKPRILKPDVMREKETRVITLSEGATAGCKQWQYPKAWQIIVDYLNNAGYEVQVISKEPTNLKNIVDKTNRPIEETIINISMSDFFMGVSSGPAWLAWALNVPVVMISGCTKNWNEFQSGNIRIINEEVCHGCFNNKDYTFDRGDWFWCPVHKDDEKRFECTKKINPANVIKAIKNEGLMR